MPKAKPFRRGIPVAEALAPPAPPRNLGAWHPHVIYYIRFRDLVKVGITRRIAHRVKAVPNEGLLAVEFGDIEAERAIHRQFGHLRKMGEWFEFGAEMGAHIVAVRARFEAQQGISTEQWFAAQG